MKLELNNQEIKYLYLILKKHEDNKIISKIILQIEKELYNQLSIEEIEELNRSKTDSYIV